MACIILWSSAVRVHDPQAYRKMDVTRERIRCIVELREILLSFQTGFNLVHAAVVCAILESISGLEPSSVITEPRYLKLTKNMSQCKRVIARLWVTPSSVPDQPVLRVLNSAAKGIINYWQYKQVRVRRNLPSDNIALSQQTERDRDNDQRQSFVAHFVLFCPIKRRPL